MKRVLITGSEGVLGTVLKAGLMHETTDFDLPQFDAKKYEHLFERLKGHDAMVHLAWDMQQDGWLGESLNPNNVLITFNVFEAAVNAGVKRVIVASSVHANKFTSRESLDLIDPYELPLPDSPYGAAKVMMESLGRYYADAKGLEVICIRFGGVNKDNTPPDDPYSERQVWLSHRDCSNLVEKCIEAETVPYNYVIINAVSNNSDKLHDTANPFGWAAVDGAS